MAPRKFTPPPTDAGDPHRPAVTPHERLGVDPHARPEELRKAWRSFARRHHPDRGGDPVWFRAGAEAYRTLIKAPRAGEVVFHRKARGLRAVLGRWLRTARGRRHRSYTRIS